MRSAVAGSSVAARSSLRKRVNARRTAGDPARTPTRLGNCPAPAVAALRTGSEPSGAVSSSVMGNRLNAVMGYRLERPCLRSVSLERRASAIEGATAPHWHALRTVQRHVRRYDLVAPATSGEDGHVGRIG